MASTALRSDSSTKMDREKSAGSGLVMTVGTSAPSQRLARNFPGVHTPGTTTPRRQIAFRRVFISWMMRRTSDHALALSSAKWMITQLSRRRRSCRPSVLANFPSELFDRHFAFAFSPIATRRRMAVASAGLSPASRPCLNLTISRCNDVRSATT
jgi:hypothetical protein